MPVAPFVIGLAFAVVLHGLVGWWLDSGPGVASTVAALFVLAVLVARDKPQALSLWLGVMIGMTAMLLSIGGGTMWPLVIVIGGVMTGMTILGAWAARRLVSLNRKGGAA